VEQLSGNGRANSLTHLVADGLDTGIEQNMPMTRGPRLALAYLTGDYAMKAIAAVFDMHYTTVMLGS